MLYILAVLGLAYIGAPFYSYLILTFLLVVLS